MSRSFAQSVVACTLALAGCSQTVTTSRGGSVDTSFAAPNGFALLTAPGATGSRAVEVAVQPDGRIVVAGRMSSAGGDDLLVARFTAAGALDSTFGSGGIFTYGGAASLADTALGLALQADGKIVVAGYANVDASWKRDVLVLRLTSAGVLDPTFGGSGIFTYNGSGSGTDIGFAVRVQPDGKIVVAGESSVSGSQDALLVRLTPAGALDPSFASGGVFLHAGAGATLDRFFDVRVLAGGGLIAAGTSGDRALVVKLDAQGALDPTFGTGGVATFLAPSQLPALAYNLCLQPDGKVVVAGTVGVDGAYDIAATRLLSTGLPDTAFGTSGWFVYQGPAQGNDAAFACALQSDGGILLAGYSDATAVALAAVIRLTSSGVPDAGFGVGGVSLHSTSSSADTVADGMTLQSDGKVVLSGVAQSASGDQGFVMRLLP